MAPEKVNPGNNISMNLEGVTVKKQGKMTTKQQVTPKIHANELHAKIGNTRVYRIGETMKHLHYIIKRNLKVCKYCYT